MRAIPTNHHVSRGLVASVLLAVTAAGVYTGLRQDLPRHTFDAGYTIVTGVHDAWAGSQESEDRP